LLTAGLAASGCKNREIIAEFHPLIGSEFENPCVDKESVSLGFPGIFHNGTAKKT